MPKAKKWSLESVDKENDLADVVNPEGDTVVMGMTIQEATFIVEACNEKLNRKAK